MREWHKGDRFDRFQDWFYTLVPIVGIVLAFLFVVGCMWKLFIS